MDRLAVDVITLMRPKQWAKNIFIFFPLLFSGEFLRTGLFVHCVLAFTGFSLVASSIYILNDCFDVRRDTLHPRKAGRASAIKRLKKPMVSFFIALCCLAGLMISYTVDQGVFHLALFYVALHLGYNFYAKKVVILDVFFVAIGFQIRIWVGSFAAGVAPSAWLQMCVFLLALFLGFAKRRHEIAFLKDRAADHRSVFAHYTTYLLDQMIIVCSTLAIVFYGLYTISGEVVLRTGGYLMVYSVPFVIYGIFRYLYLIHVHKLGDDAGQILFSDVPLMITIILWIAFCVEVIYFL